MRSARYYAVEAEEIRRAMYDVRDKKLRALLGRIARSYEQLAAEIDGGRIKIAFAAIREQDLTASPR